MASMIKAIFYTRFHPEKGPTVLYQVPEGAIVPPSQALTSLQQPLFDFPSVASLLIPRQEFCDRLVTVCINHYRVIGFPVCIQSSRYDRNQFIFNLALVLDEDADFSAHASVIRKLASLFRNLEEQSMFLSTEEEELFKQIAKKRAERTEASMINHDEDNAQDGMSTALSNSLDLGGDTNHTTKVYAICEMIMEDLNNYCECMIPLDDANTINLKLFQTRPPPPPVYPWHVPLATVQLTNISISSDLTLTRILPYIDGICSVAQIAQLADTDLGLTRNAIAHLLYYRCVLLLDIFQFSAIYAPTAEIGAFVEDDEAQDEARRYVCVGHYRRLSDREADGASRDQWAWKGRESTVDKTTLVRLYISLKQGLTLKNWSLEHDILLAGVDVRRFITFGIIRGFLYRVQKYAIVDSGALNGNATSFKPDGFGADNDGAGYGRHSQRESNGGSSTGRELPLARYLDGMHCFDEICTELQLTEKKLTEKIRSACDDVQIIHR